MTDDVWPALETEAGRGETGRADQMGISSG